MTRSLLALLRGHDGRSIARALACLLLLNAVVAGLHTGVMAAPADASVLCTVSMGDESAPALDQDHLPPCCPALCAPGALGVSAPSSPGIVLPPPSDNQPRLTEPPASRPPLHATSCHAPRGPPHVA